MRLPADIATPIYHPSSARKRVNTSETMETFEPSSPSRASSANSAVVYTNPQYTTDYMYSNNFSRRNLDMNGLQSSAPYYNHNYLSPASNQPRNALQYTPNVASSLWLMNYPENVVVPIGLAQPTLPESGSGGGESFGLVEGENGCHPRLPAGSKANVDERPVQTLADINALTARDLEAEQIGNKSSYNNRATHMAAAAQQHPQQQQQQQQQSSYSSIFPPVTSTDGSSAGPLLPDARCMMPQRHHLSLDAQPAEPYLSLAPNSRVYVNDAADSHKLGNHGGERHESPSDSLVNGDELSYKEDDYDHSQLYGMDDDELHGYNARKLNKRHWGTGRKKIEIKYIDKKLKRQITFSKRKSGMMKKIHELATLTGTQALLVLVSETGHFYSYATSKLRNLVTDERKNVIKQALEEYDIIRPNEQRPPGYNC